MSHRVIAEVGIVPGIAVVSLLGIAIVVATTEAGVRLIASIGADRRWIPRVRLVGYGFPALLWGVVSIHNGVLLLLTL